LGERLLCKQEVIGSIPFTSTTGEPRVRRAAGVAAAFRAPGQPASAGPRRSEKMTRDTVPPALCLGAGVLIERVKREFVM
jgi:hypothetical protein